MSYQSFGNKKGSSNSEQKYICLNINSSMIKDKKVLDIGCNEGFFCDKFIKLGASSCLGLDASSNFITLAKSRFNYPNLKFQNIDIAKFETSEKYDIILIASALHYMDAKQIIPKVKSLLNEGGLFIFEGGVIQDKTVNEWKHIKRSIDTVIHPTSLALKELIETNFSRISYIGKSVNQVGDPIPRFVYHCNF